MYMYKFTLSFIEYNFSFSSFILTPFVLDSRFLLNLSFKVDQLFMLSSVF